MKQNFKVYNFLFHAFNEKLYEVKCEVNMQIIVVCTDQRCIYKDIVLLLQADRYLTEKELRAKVGTFL